MSVRIRVLGVVAGVLLVAGLLGAACTSDNDNGSSGAGPTATEDQMMSETPMATEDMMSETPMATEDHMMSETPMATDDHMMSETPEP